MTSDSRAPGCSSYRNEFNDRKIIDSEHTAEPTPVEARIASLKILAQSLIHLVESFEKEANSVSPRNLDVPREVRRFEAALIRSALIKTCGRQRQAARLLGMKFTTFHSKVKRYRITLEEVEPPDDDSKRSLEAVRTPLVQRPSSVS